MNKSQQRNFLLYAFGRLVSLIGSGIQMIAIPLYILDLTGSGTMMGVFTFFSFLPTLVMAPFAGVLGDRWNRKKIMVNMDYARGALILFLAALAITNNMSIYILFACQVVISLMGSIFGSSTSGMFPELVGEDDLMRANSIMGGIDSFSMIVGPILGGIIYGFGGIKYVFLINGVSFILSAISEMFIKYTSTTESKEKISAKVFFEDFKEGFEFIKATKSIRSLIFYACAANFLLSPAFSVVIPYGLKEFIGFRPEHYGIMSSGFTIGILAGNILIASVLAKSSSKLLMRLGLFVQTSINFAFALTLLPDSVSYFGGPSVLLLAIILIEFIIMGLFNAFVNTPLSANFQKIVPNKMRSRVFSVLGMLVQAGVPFGAVIYGVLLDLIPVYALYMTISILYVVLTVVFLRTAPAEAFEPKKVNIEAS